jgi:ATP-binding cassette, subfamily B, bacterial
MPTEQTRKVSVRQLPALVRVALGITWRANPHDLIVSTALQAVGGLAIVVLLLLAKQTFDALLTAATNGGTLADVLPWVLAMAVVAAGQSYANTVQRERQQILGDLVTRSIQGRVLDVTSQVDLATFDDPEFHNRVERVGTNNHQPLQMVFGVSGLAGAAFGVIGGLIGVVAVAPVLLPLLALVAVPAWLAASRRGAAF